MNKAYYSALVTNAGLTKYSAQLKRSLGNFHFISFSGEAAERDFFLKNEIDVILLHIDEYPAAIELLKFFKSVKSSVPVISVTERGCESLLLQLLRNGVWDYFSPPIDFEEVNQSIRTVLGLKEGVIEREFKRQICGTERAIAYINENFSSRLSLPEVAKVAGMSVSSFERRFKEKMETTFVCYVNTLRIRKAVHLLGEKHCSMNDIAFACGFSNSWHFSRTFKKIKKKPPTLFRNSQLR